MPQFELGGEWAGYEMHGGVVSQESYAWVCVMQGTRSDPKVAG
jgi:hypothetical protein